MSGAVVVAAGSHKDAEKKRSKIELYFPIQGRRPLYEIQCLQLITIQCKFYQSGACYTHVLQGVGWVQNKAVISLLTTAALTFLLDVLKR